MLITAILNFYLDFKIDTSLLGQVFATFFTASDSFLNTKNLRSTMFQAVFRNFILQLFSFLRATFYCNFH